MWESMVVKIDNYLPRIQEELDKANSDGWELVSTLYDTNDCYFYLFFKRPKH